jgi:hypothetical protein
LYRIYIALIFPRLYSLFWRVYNRVALFRSHDSPAPIRCGGEVRHLGLSAMPGPSRDFVRLTTGFCQRDSPRLPQPVGRFGDTGSAGSFPDEIPKRLARAGAANGL